MSIQVHDIRSLGREEPRRCGYLAEFLRAGLLWELPGGFSFLRFHRTNCGSDFTAQLMVRFAPVVRWRRSVRFVPERPVFRRQTSLLWDDRRPIFCLQCRWPERFHNRRSGVYHPGMMLVRGRTPWCPTLIPKVLHSKYGYHTSWVDR